MKMSGLSHIGDIFAIPFFLWLVIYFYQIEDKTPTEYVLMAFSTCGFALDILFTWLYFRKHIA